VLDIIPSVQDSFVINSLLIWPGRTVSLLNVVPDLSSSPRYNPALENNRDVKTPGDWTGLQSLNLPGALNLVWVKLTALKVLTVP
jgi:hypothetical protein